MMLLFNICNGYTDRWREAEDQGMDVLFSFVGTSPQTHLTRYMYTQHQPYKPAKDYVITKPVNSTHCIYTHYGIHYAFMLYTLNKSAVTMCGTLLI